MKPASASLALLIALQANSQTTALQQVRISTGPRDSRVDKIFFINAGKDSVKQGHYEENHLDRIIVTGSYKDNTKDGTWERKYQGRTLSRRQYSNGQRTGTWEFFNQRTPAFQYDAANNAVFNLKEDTAAYYYYTTAGTWVKDQLDSPPIPLMSPYEWQTWLVTKLRYPPDALDAHQQGEVLVEITIDETGTPVGYEVKGSVMPSLDAEALRLIKEFGFEFVPALKNGMKVRTKYVQPIVYRLQ